MTNRTVATEAREGREMRTPVRCETNRAGEIERPRPAAPCQFKLWEAERREAAS